MTLPQYGEYKDSGVEWLGEVPRHWKVLPLKRDLAFLTSGSRGWAEHYSDDGALFIRIGNLTRDSIRLDLSDLQRVEVPSGTEGERTRVLAGDVLFSITAYLGSVAVVPDNLERSYVSQHVALARLRKRYFIPAWVAYVTLSFIGKTYLETQGYGGTKIQLSLDDVANLIMTAPPLPEQTAIAAFLDRETGKIDALVAEQEKLIALLKEKRQAVISHAVTKGLNPAAPMKNTGIKWLGEVPAHWEIMRGRFLFQQLDLPPQEGDGVVTAFRDGQVTLRELRRQDGFTLAVLEVGYQRVREGDLVIHGMDAFAGAIGVSEATGKCTPEYAVLTPARTGINNRYFALALRLMALRNFIYVICPSVRERAPRFRYETFKDVALPLPPLAEQHNILAEIATETAKLDALTAEAQRAIDLLKERRTALISAAVTGKIDVRGLVDMQEAA